MYNKHIDQGLYNELSRVYGSFTKKVLSLLKKPSTRHYLRVNTMVITRDELLELLREKYPEYTFNPDPYVDEAIYIVVKGPFKIPVVDKKIVVDWYAAESIVLGANLYVPGVIYYDDFRKGEEVNIVTPSGEVIAYGVAEVDSARLKYLRKGVVAKNIVSLYKIPPIADMDEFKQGLFYPQSLPAMLVSKIIDPKPGEAILDCCAAPGGKTTHVIQLTRGLAKLVAVDRSISKIKKIVENIRRLKLPRNLHIILGDSRYLHVDMVYTKFDKVLIDPPCTGIGFRPKLIIDKSYRDVINNVNYQKQFISSAKHLVKEKGLLVYSTCTITFSENEGLSMYIRDNGFKSIELDLPYASKVYINDVVGYRFDPLINDMNGYYIAVFEKK